jgi:hypothetical protein
MKKVLFPLFVSLFILAGCGSPEPENLPEPSTRKFDKTEESENIGFCLVKRTITCIEAPGDFCSEPGFSGSFEEPIPNCNYTKNKVNESDLADLAEKHPNSYKIGLLLRQNKLKQLFNEKSWRKIVPELSADNRIVAMIKNMNLTGRLVNKEYLVIYQNPVFNNAEPNGEVLAMVRINNFIPKH